MTGPTEWSNWVIKDQLLVGAYPKKTFLIEDILKEGNP